MINNVFKFPNRYNCRKTVAKSKSFIVNTVKFHTPIYQGVQIKPPCPYPPGISIYQPWESLEYGYFFKEHIYSKLVKVKFYI